jgi:hypothetical protein
MQQQKKIVIEIEYTDNVELSRSMYKLKKQILAGNDVFRHATKLYTGKYQITHQGELQQPMRINNNPVFNYTKLEEMHPRIVQHENHIEHIYQSRLNKTT